MVWVGGSQGTLAPSLVDLFLEADRRWPNRSKASDGSLGDSAHASRDSDHNPKIPNPPGWVDAGDLTDDKASGCDADLLAHHLVASRDPRVKYVIWNGTVVRSYAKPGLPAWTPEPYTGLNAHEKHTHISVTEAGRHIRAPWFPQEDDMTDDESRMLKALYDRIGTIDATETKVEQLWARRGLIDSIANFQLGDDVDEAEVARQVLAGLSSLSDAQVRTIVDAIPEQVKRALREGVG